MGVPDPDQTVLMVDSYQGYPVIVTEPGKIVRGKQMTYCTRAAFAAVRASLFLEVRKIHGFPKSAYPSSW
jgi:IS1 family transposase